MVIVTDASLRELFLVFSKYEMATNARINQGKTEGLWIGQWMNRTDKPLGLKWNSDKINFLGIYVR